MAGGTADAAVGTSRLRADGAEPTAPRFHLAATGHAGADGVLSGFAWGAGDPVTFSFPDAASDYEGSYGIGEPARGFAQIGVAMREAVRLVLVGQGREGGAPGSPGPHVTGFTNLVVQEAAQDGAADIRIARSSAPSTAWAYYPNAREGGDVWFGNRHGFDQPRLGTYQFVVAVHELGHALGLKHPHEHWNGFGPMPQEWDSLESTVMSYRSKPGAPVTSGYTNGTYDFPQGWMMLDIAALQAMYGADYGHLAGDTRYAWDPATGETFIDGAGRGRPGGDWPWGGTNKVFLTIWDGGGVDTYDLSAYANGVAVDLAPGGHSRLSTSQLAVLDTRDGTTARGNVFNALLHEGNAASLVENAVGGAGADTLSGNLAANRLEGGGGADLLSGLAGNDALVGGAGADTLRGGAGHDRYVATDTLDLVQEEDGAGVDILQVETPAGPALPGFVEILLLGSGGIAGLGNGGPNLLLGNAGGNRLEGRGGVDVIEGRGGADTLLGGEGADSFLLRRGDGFDRIEDFAPGLDRLVLTGFAASAAELLAGAVAQGGGTRLDLGGGDGLFLAGVAKTALSAADLVL
jgi:serralysin